MSPRLTNADYAAYHLLELRRARAQRPARALRRRGLPDVHYRKNQIRQLVSIYLDKCMSDRLFANLETRVLADRSNVACGCHSGQSDHPQHEPSVVLLIIAMN